MDLIDAPSPNFDTRTAPPDMIVLHYTGMKTGEAALDRLRDPTPGGRVSAHYLVEEDGRVFRLVDEARRAWHAGVASWKGQTDINSRSVGIEIVNPGHEFGYRDFPEPQVAAVIALVGDIRSRWTIVDGDIVGHSDVAPARKPDPGERFPWKRLAAAGHGLWVEPPPAPGAPYDCPPTGRFDAATREVVTAFQRHWVQSRIDGVADGLTRARLIALLRLGGG